MVYIVLTHCLSFSQYHWTSLNDSFTLSISQSDSCQSNPWSSGWWIKGHFSVSIKNKAWEVQVRNLSVSCSSWSCLYFASSTLFFLVCRLFTLSNYFYCSFFCIILTSQSSIWECSRLEPQTLIWSTVTFVVDFGRFSNYFILLMPWEVTNISNSNLEMLSLNLDSTQFCMSRPTHTFKAGCLMNISALTDTKVNFWLFSP